MATCNLGLNVTMRRLKTGYLVRRAMRKRGRQSARAASQSAQLQDVIRISRLTRICTRVRGLIHTRQFYIYICVIIIRNKRRKSY